MNAGFNVDSFPESGRECFVRLTNFQNAMTEPKKPAHPLVSVAGIVGAAGGWAVSHYSGAALWIPGIASLLLGLLFAKTPVHPRYFRGTIVITGGHLIWFIAGSIVLNDWTAAGLDILILTGCLAWLWIRPNLAAAIVLGCVQLGMLWVNVISIMAASIGSPAHRALTVHCLWRVLSIGCLIFDNLKMRREKMAEPIPPPFPS
jgi:hypothetical protein